ncbi:MAG: glutamyl-tRNA reductase [Acidobacteriota bacterium]
MSGAPAVIQVGLDHRCAPLALLEALRLKALDARVGTGLWTRCSGVVSLATCHRLELYLEGVDSDTAREMLGCWLGLDAAATAGVSHRSCLRVGGEAGRHLLRVAAGLESAVLGEDQILGQVRQAYRQACVTGGAGPLLHRLFHAAFRAGRRVRTETSLGRGGRSLAGAAVSFAARSLDGLAGRDALVVGAGEMGSLAAQRLRDRGVRRLLVCSRKFDRAVALASTVGAEALPWEWRLSAMAEVDVVVCATGAPGTVIPARSAAVAAATGSRIGPLVVVDLAVPRDVEAPAEPVPGLVLADIAVLTQDLQADAVHRAEAVGAATAIVEEELAEWLTWALTRPSGGRERVAGRGSLAG